jgi:hypothetical protein
VVHFHFLVGSLDDASPFLVLDKLPQQIGKAISSRKLMVES